MKKIIFLVVIFIMATCMVACSNNTPNDDNDVTTTTVPLADEEVTVPDHSIDSNGFIKTALLFIDEYSTPSKKLENLSAELIQQSDVFRDTVYTYLNNHLIEEYDEDIVRQSLGFGYEKVETVKVYIHNYDVGGNIGCASFNGQSPFYNYEHDKYMLAAGVIGEKYPDNVTLAEARVASFILFHMSQDDVEAACIITNSEGKKSYDFTFNNEAFKETAKEVLQNLCEG